MKVIDLKHAEGANEWSALYKSLIILDVEIADGELSGEKEKVMLLNEIEIEMPSLIDYESGGLKKTPVTGGKGSFIALMVELLSAELQVLSGQPAGFSDSFELPGKKGMHRIIFSCDKKETGTYAANAAVNMINAILQDRPTDICGHLQELIALQHASGIEHAA